MSQEQKEVPVPEAVAEQEDQPESSSQPKQVVKEDTHDQKSTEQIGSEILPQKSKAKKEKKPVRPMRSLTNAEYDAIFDAVLAVQVEDVVEDVVEDSVEAKESETVIASFEADVTAETEEKVPEESPVEIKDKPENTSKENEDEGKEGVSKENEDEGKEGVSKEKEQETETEEENESKLKAVDSGDLYINIIEKEKFQKSKSAEGGAQDITEDDFDAILHENDVNIGKYVEAFLSEEEEKMDEEEMLTSTPILEQATHSSPKKKKKGSKKKLPAEKPPAEKTPAEKPHMQAPAEKKETKLKVQENKVQHQQRDQADVEKISKKDKMLKRTVPETGTWVQCEDCGKWRYLADATDPALLPVKWTCMRNPDSDHNTCSSEEEAWDLDQHTDDYVFNKYTEGSVVWARMAGFPWWPALVEIDPDTESYFECNTNMQKAHGKTNVATHYHVVFFDDKVSRAWVCSASVHVFTGMEDMGTCKSRGVNYKKQVAKSVDMAINCLELSLQERIKNYGFAARYQGKWAASKVGLDKKQKKVAKRKRKRSKSCHLDTSMLEDAEKLLRNTENVLDELLSLSESEELEESEPPKKKRKTDTSKKPKKTMESDKENTKRTNEDLPSKIPTQEPPMKKVKKTPNTDGVPGKVASRKKPLQPSENNSKPTMEKDTQQQTEKGGEKVKKGKKKVKENATDESVGTKKAADKVVEKTEKKDKAVKKPVFGGPKVTKVRVEPKATKVKEAEEDKTVKKNGAGTLNEKKDETVEKPKDDSPSLSSNAKKEDSKIKPKDNVALNDKKEKVVKAKKGFVAPVRPVFAAKSVEKRETKKKETHCNTEAAKSITEAHKKDSDGGSSNGDKEDAKCQESTTSEDKDVKSDSKEEQNKSDSKEEQEKSDSKEEQEKSDSIEEQEKSDSIEEQEKSDSKNDKEKSDSKDEKEASDSKDDEEKSDFKDDEEKSDSKDDEEKSDSKDDEEKSDSKDDEEKEEKSDSKDDEEKSDSMDEKEILNSKVEKENLNSKEDKADLNSKDAKDKSDSKDASEKSDSKDAKEKSKSKDEKEKLETESGNSKATESKSLFSDDEDDFDFMPSPEVMAAISSENGKQEADAQQNLKVPSSLVNNENDAVAANKMVEEDADFEFED